MKSHLTLFLFIISPFFVLSQTLTGRIENINGEKIPFANVITRDSVNATAIKEFVIARNGVYSITLTKQYKQLVLEVSSNKYQNEIFVIDSFIATKNYTHNFFLVKDTVVKLQDVVVTAKVRPFQIKGDTVNYNVAAYRNGTERKIQDVLKKLPGIEVNEKTGEIKYKGKSVETVKLDGDDLFAANYSIGTKNINVDMVEQVQAIENYSDNPLLKGIESGDKVALNLTLKKKKADYSGSLDFGLGTLGSKAATAASADILGIAKKFKSFATVSYNNIGINNTPFDYFSYTPNIEQLREADLLAKKYIPDNYFNTDIDANRSNINSLLFSSYNAVLKIRKRISLKSNIYYLSDRLSSQQLNVAANTINGQEFITSDNYSITKKPRQIRGDFEVKYNVSKKSLLEYSVQYKKEKINTLNDVFQNNNATFKTTLNTKDDYFKQAATYTTKLSDKQALQLNVKHTYNTAPQYLLFFPAIFEPLFYQQNNQASWFKKNNVLLQSTLLGSSSKGKYSLSAGSTFKNIDYDSELVGINGTNETSLNTFENQFKYKQNSTFIDGNFNFKFRRFRVTPSITLSSLHQKLVNGLSNLVKDTANILIEPNLSAVYKISNFSALLITAGFKQKPFTEEYFAENPVYISNRVMKENQVSLQLQKSKNVSLFYLISNLYKQFQLNIGANYAENNGNYFSDLLIQQNLTKSVSFFLPEKASLFSANFMIEKYVPFLQGTIRLTNDFTKQFYKNIVNGSLLRNNTSESFNSNFFFKTAFDGKFNFENTVVHRYFRTTTEGGFQFNNQSIKNNFQVIIKPTKRLLLLFSTDYYLPNTKENKQSYLFLDTDLSYQTINKIYDFRFKARNISNIKSLNQIDITDYSTNNFQTNLLPRQIVLSVSRNF